MIEVIDEASTTVRINDLVDLNFVIFKYVLLG